MRVRRSADAAGFDEKKNTADLVTETDQNTEKLVCESIKARFPDHQFIGEESWAAGEQAEVTDAPTWIIDPIDGTTNFVKGFPFVCISIGFVYQSEPVVGVIFAPFMGQLYAARKGSGAFMTSPLHPERRSLPLAQPQPLPSLKQALLAFEWGSDRSKEVMDMKSRTFQRLTGDAAGGVQGGEMALGVRSVGSAALNFAHVASGCLDLYWEIGCWAWDVCAGMVIAREAYVFSLTQWLCSGRLSGRRGRRRPGRVAPGGHARGPHRPQVPRRACDRRRAERVGRRRAEAHHRRLLRRGGRVGPQVGYAATDSGCRRAGRRSARRRPCSAPWYPRRACWSGAAGPAGARRGCS